MESTRDSTQAPIVNIVGEKVALGPLRRDLIPLWVKWLNDFEVTMMLGVVGPRPMTVEAEEAWYERTTKDERQVHFVIYELPTMRPIGTTGLHNVDYKDQTAEFGIFIGDKEAWGKGYGTETTRLVLEYGFSALGLHNIMLRVFSYNQRAIRAYTRAGFKLIGRWREAHRVGNRAYDEILMDCLSTEFQGTALRSLAPEG
jgi:diamine N-acetyltransferase